MWNFENCNPSNKNFSWNIKLDEIHKFNKRYYYTIDIVYNEEKKKFVSTVSLFEKTWNKIFDMEVEMNKSFSSSSVEDAKKEIIEYLEYLANSNIGWSSFFLAKKMFIQHGSYRKYWKSMIFMQDITFFIPEKQNKNNFTQIFKEWYYLVSIYSDRFRLGNNIPTIHIPYFERNWEIEFFFYSQEIREVETLKKEIIWEDTFYSNNNKLLDKYYTITNDRLNISNIIYYKPLKMLFSFFEKQLDKKWIKNYEIFLWNYENNFNSRNYSSLYSVAIQLQIFVNGVFDEKLTKELMEIYSQTWWNISRKFLWNINGEDVYWKYINFLVDKFSPIFTFDKDFSEDIIPSNIDDLWHDYFYIYSFGGQVSQLWKNNIYKYSYEENKFIPLEKPSQTDQIFDKFSSKKWFCYINSNAELKIFIEWDKEYTIDLVKAFEINDTSKLNRESFKDLMIVNNWKEIFVSYEKKIIYLPLKEWIWFDKIHKFEYQYIFEQKTIFGHTWYWLREGYGYFNATVWEVKINIPTCNLINFDPKTILFKKIIINDLYLKKPFDDSTTFILDGYRIMYGLKWYFFIKKQNFELKKEIRDEDVRKENLFSKWVCKYIGNTTRIINNSYRTVSTSQNSAIEKLSKGVMGKKVFGISNWKIWFYE